MFDGNPHEIQCIALSCTRNKLDACKLRRPTLTFREFHLIHPFALIPMQKGPSFVHGPELPHVPLEQFLNRSLLRLVSNGQGP